MTDFLYIRKIVLEVLSEADMTSHFSERSIDRVLASGKVRIGYWLGLPGKHKAVGWYTIPPMIISDIKRKIDVLANRNIPKNCDYNIVLQQFNIKVNEVTFDSPQLKAEYLASKRPLLITDATTNSNGTVLSAIVKGNYLVTIMFQHNASVSATQDKRGILIKDFANVERGTLRCP